MVGRRPISSGIFIGCLRTIFGEEVSSRTSSLSHYKVLCRSCDCLLHDPASSRDIVWRDYIRYMVQRASARQMFSSSSVQPSLWVHVVKLSPTLRKYVTVGFVTLEKHDLSSGNGSSFSTHRRLVVFASRKCTDRSCGCVLTIIATRTMAIFAWWVSNLSWAYFTRSLQDKRRHPFSSHKRAIIVWILGNSPFTNVSSCPLHRRRFFNGAPRRLYVCYLRAQYPKVADGYSVGR